jgi:alpha,alpha-trehalase
MKNKIILTFLCFTIMHITTAQKTPDKIYGQLFVDVQLGKIFPDNKTFVDCTPKRKVADIMYDYGLQKSASLDLKKFVTDNFEIPIAPAAYNEIQREKDVIKHINSLWIELQRASDKKVDGSSLIPLPYPYIVPGGRFREIYYWDSYFTMQGLKACGKTDIIENMINNFAFLIDTYGHIPNGNRTYYVSRSQPPFFCMMVELLAEIKGDAVYKKYLPQMQKEYDYWMEGAATLKNGTANKRVVKLKNGTILNRYWDDLEIPRQESYKEDVKTAEEASMEKMMVIRFASEEMRNKFKDDTEKNIYKNLRTGACSGWDFSSRWFADANKLSTIQITDIAPVDLNALMYKMEILLANGYKLSKQETKHKKMLLTATNRFKTFETIFFSKALNFFSDYNFINQTTTDVPNAAAIYPICMSIPLQKNYKETGIKAKAYLEKYLLKDGGIVSTPNANGQQWDAPNGWAPQQWMVITGLEKCGQSAFAKDIATRWITLNNAVYLRTGKLMEKYNVIDTKLEAGGGEYPSQDGFGWTNGVLQALIKKYDPTNNYLKQ